MPDTPPNRRRWISYGLRSFFAVFTLIALCIAWIASERRQSQFEMRMVDELNSSGAVVGISEDFDEKHPFAARSRDKPVAEQSSLRHALSWLFGPRIRTVDFSRKHMLTDISPVANLTSLQALSFDGSNLGDLSSLAKLKELRALVIYPATEVRDLSPLVGLTSLEYLITDRSHASDIEPLRGLRRLKSLRLNASQVGNLSPLAGLKQLRFLALDLTEVSDIAPLAELSSLEGLGLDATKVKDISPLARLQSLSKLSIRTTKVTDLSPLAGLKNLRTLYLQETPASEDQVKALQASLPDCRIYSDFNPSGSNP